MQQKVKELQDQLERLEIVGISGAGLVKVTVNGKQRDAQGRDRRLRCSSPRTRAWSRT